MWTEQEKNLIWVNDDFWGAEELAEAEEMTRRNFELIERSSLNEVAKITNTSFHYYQVNISSEIRFKIYQNIWTKLNSFILSLKETELSFPSEKVSSLFFKRFSKGSHYHLHAEDKKIFGEWAYILYLSDEESSPLVFPTLDSINNMDNSTELENWVKMKTFLESNGTSISYPSVNRQIAPQKNRCVLFRTGVPHRISKYLKNDGRPCFTGFPNATIY